MVVAGGWELERTSRTSRLPWLGAARSTIETGAFPQTNEPIDCAHPSALRSGMDQTTRPDHDRGKPRRFGCDTSNRTDRIAMVPWASGSLYASAGALLCSIITLPTFFVGLVESMRTP